MPRAGRWVDPMQPPWPRHGVCAASPSTASGPPTVRLTPLLPEWKNDPKGESGWVELLARQLARCHRATRA
eukprot:835725-Pleurochrysis_carterae.AAC.1